MDWLLFLPQLPGSPSTLRVTIWRRLRAVGAFALQNGAWILPATSEMRQFTEQQMAYIKAQQAVSYIFEVASLNPEVEEVILTGFRCDRDEEYAEFSERAEAFLAELDKESLGEKFTFAELEEAEVEVNKLEAWLTKITARDFIGGGQKQLALDNLKRCQAVYQHFAANVHARQGLDNGGEEK